MMRNNPYSNFFNRSRHALFLLSMLLVGGDLISIRLGGLTFRVFAFFILVVWFLDILQNKGKVKLGSDVMLAVALLCIGAILSIPLSIDVFRSIAYTAWLLFTIFVVVPVFYRFSFEVSVLEVIRIWFMVYRIQVVLLFIELAIAFTSGEFERPHLWFYEPSYAALYFSAYVGASMYLVANGFNWAKKDLAWAIVALLLLSSATGFYAVVFAILFNVLLSRYKVRFAIASLLPSALFFLVMHLALSDTMTYKLLFGYLFGIDTSFSGIFFAIFERGGTRLCRMLWGWDAFLANPWVGIGFGADQTYTTIMPVSPSAEPFLKPWHDVIGNPFVNPFIEAASTMGVIGLLGMLIFVYFCFVMFRSVNAKNDPEVFFVKAIVTGFFIMFFTLQFEGTFLRFYLWSTFGLACGAIARWQCISKFKGGL